MSKYNPMSKEFQEEMKRLGLSGNQLIKKYIEEGKLTNPSDIKREQRDITFKNARCNNAKEYKEYLMRRAWCNNAKEYNDYLLGNRNRKGLRKGTLILTEDITYIPIEEIKLGDIILGLIYDNYYLKLSPARVLNIFSGIDIVIKINTNHGDIYSAIDHEWLADRRRWWKTIHFAKGQFLKNLSLPIKKHIETKNYKIGYIAGAYDGDGYISLGNRTIPDQAKLVGDYEMMDKVLEYSNELGIGLYESPYDGGKFALDTCIMSVNRSVVTYITNIIDIDKDPNDEYKRGYLAGIYDAEGGWSMTYEWKLYRSSIRIYNTNEKILERIAGYLHHFGFKIELDIMEPKGSAIRILGGLEEFIKFFSLVNPKAENKKQAIFDYHLKIKESSIILGITNIGISEIYNLETSTNNFIANGFVTHDITQSKTDLQY